MCCCICMCICILYIYINNNNNNNNNNICVYVYHIYIYIYVYTCAGAVTTFGRRCGNSAVASRHGLSRHSSCVAVPALHHSLSLDTTV